MTRLSIKRTAGGRLIMRLSGLLVIGFTVISLPAATAGAIGTAPVAGAGGKAVPTAYITNYQQGTVSVLHGAKVVRTISDVGPGPAGIAVAPGGTTAYVADFGYINSPGDTVTPIDLTTGTPGMPITVGSGPFAIAITSNGLYAAVTLLGVGEPKGDEMVRITLADGKVSKPVTVGQGPQSLAISPDSTTAYVGSYGVSSADASITPVDIATTPPVALAPIAIANTAPSAMAMAPDGETLYVTDAEGAQLIPISIPSDVVGTGLNLICTQQGDPGCSPEGLTITSNGTTAWVAAAGSSDLLKVALSSFTVVRVEPTGGYPYGVGVADGWVYSANAASNDASVIHKGKVVGSPTTGEYPLGVVVLPAA